jgi:hypothetical protein
VATVNGRLTDFMSNRVLSIDDHAADLLIRALAGLIARSCSPREVAEAYELGCLIEATAPPAKAKIEE